MSKPAKPRKAYLISYDNGHDYEDHRRQPLFLVRTQQEADCILARVAKWTERQKALLPPTPQEKMEERGRWDDSPPLTDEEIIVMDDARRERIAALKPPFGITSLRATLDGRYDDPYGRLIVTELDYWTRRWKEDAE